MIKLNEIRFGDIVKTIEVFFQYGDSIFTREENIDSFIKKSCKQKGRIGEITDMPILHGNRYDEPSIIIFEVMFIVKNNFKGILMEKRTHIHSNAFTKATKEECDKFLKLKEDIKLQKFAGEL
jgi:hypothetical protein